MKSKIILTAASTLILSACFLGGDDDTSSPADMSKPVSFEMASNNKSYTVSGNKATVLDINSECTVGGGYKEKIDTSYYIYLGNSKLQYLDIYSYSTSGTGGIFTKDTTLDTLVGGNALENSTWYRIYSYSGKTDSSAHTLRSGKIYHQIKNFCPASEAVEDLVRYHEDSYYGVTDTNSIKATGCGTLSFNTSLNGKNFAITRTFKLNMTNGTPTSLTEVLSINGTTCTRTENAQETPITASTCKSAWNAYTAQNGTDTTKVSSYWYEDYIGDKTDYETFKTCRNKALGISDSTMLKRKLNRILR